MTTLQESATVPQTCTYCHREALSTLLTNGRETPLCPSCRCWIELDIRQEAQANGFTLAPAAPAPEAPCVDTGACTQSFPCWECSTCTPIYGLCEACNALPAARLFVHLDGRDFQLCESCWSWADHDDDYLMFCDCMMPRYAEDNIHCVHCRYEIRDRVDPDEDYDEDSADSDSEEEDNYPAESREAEEDADDETWGYPTIDR